MKELFSGVGPKITVIGGGTGMSVILSGLKKITGNLAAVVTMSDDGGSSGMLREDLGMLPPGDIRSCLMALADVEEDFGNLMKFRFGCGSLTGQSMGNLILAGLAMMAGSFEKGLEKAHDIFRINGRVIPVTCQEITLCANLTGGTKVRGESNIPKTGISGEGRIHNVYLEPERVTALHEAKEAILHADIILIGPGSLYTSLIPNLLVGGICESIAGSRAEKIMICNVMTQKGETDGFSVTDHVNEIEKYLKTSKINAVMVNNHIIDDDTIHRYNIDGVSQVILSSEEKEVLENRGIRVIDDNFTDIKMGYIRHNADRIAKKIEEIYAGK